MAGTLALLVALAAGGCGERGTGDEPVGEVPVDARKLTMQVDGMTCAGCEMAISDRLSAVDGVFEVKASRKESRAWVSFDPAKTSAQKLVDEVNELGYTARAIGEAEGAPARQP